MLYPIVAAFILLGCKNQKSIDCDYSQMKDLNISYTNGTIKIPKQCILQDTLMYGTEILMNHQYGSLDSSLLLFVYVNEDKGFSDKEKNFAFVTDKQRAGIIFGTKSHQQITDTVVMRSDIKVGYLKYVIEKADGKFVWSKLFFVQNKKVCVVELLEKYKNKEQEKQSFADCMLESLKIN